MCAGKPVSIILFRIRFILFVVSRLCKWRVYFFGNRKIFLKERKIGLRALVFGSRTPRMEHLKRQFVESNNKMALYLLAVLGFIKNKESGGMLSDINIEPRDLSERIFPVKSAACRLFF